MADLALLAGIEQKYNGPIPPRSRWIMRLGGIEAYRQANAKSVIRHTTLRAPRVWSVGSRPNSMTTEITGKNG
jgi:hypothetical protein